MRKIYVCLMVVILGAAVIVHTQTVLVGGISSVATPVQIAAPGTPVQPAAPDSIVQVVADAQGLPLLSPDQAQFHGGIFCYWWVMPGGAYCPMPFLPQDASAVFQIADDQYLVDETGGQVIGNTRRPGGTPTRAMLASTLATQADWLVGLITQVQTTALNRQLRTTMLAMGMDLPPLPGDGGFGGGTGGDYTNSFNFWFDHTQLWLEFTNVNMSAGWTGLNLHNATNLVYAIKSTTNLATPCASWQVETEVWPTDTNCMTFSLATLNRQNLFLRAMDWTGVTENGNTVPDWWLWKYFGTTALFDTNLDSQGNPLVSDFTNGFDPNVITFTVSATNLYVNQTTVPLQINVTAGVPNYFAVLVNGQTTTNWLPFTTPNLPVNLGTTDGVYVVSVGLRGLPADATQTWASLALTLDTTPPVLTLTNLPALTGSRPFIDPAGYVNKALSSLNYTVVDANGGTNSGSGLVVAQGLNPTDPYHVTNSFQCVDLALALGVNQISIQAVDWTGNVAVTNFNYIFDTNGDTTAPAINLTWPPSGTSVSGDRFTVQGTLDDDTATASLQYTDTNGILQTVNGLVERGGNLWFENVPLVPGTNNFSLTTTDAAGNLSTTNINNVMQSDLSLTITPLSGDAMNYALATVTGTVSDPAALISVNGIQGTNAGGYWEVDNVPLSPGGTVTLLATAQPQAGPATQTLLEADRQPVVFTQTYASTLDEVEDYVYPWNQVHFEQHGFAQWNRNGGGTNRSYGYSTDFSTGGYATNWDVTIWPADNGYLPMLPGTRISYSYVDYGAETEYYGGPYEDLVTNLVAAPSVEWMEKSAAQMRGRYNNDQVTYASQEGNRRQIRLATGGKAIRQRSTLFSLSTALKFDRNLFMQYSHPLADFEDGMPMHSMMDAGDPPMTVPPEQIALDALGNLGSDGNLWIMLLAGQEYVITPTVAGGSAEGSSSAFQANDSKPTSSADSAENIAGQPLPTAPQYPLAIKANGITLSNDVVAAGANFCVGQNVRFELSGLPNDGSVIATNFQWKLDGTFVNKCIPAPNANSSDTYVNDTNLLKNAVLLTNWWVSGGTPETYTAMAKYGLLFTNGNLLQPGNASGLFNMYRPKAKITTHTTEVSVHSRRGYPMLSFCPPQSGEGITFSNTIDIPQKPDGTTFSGKVEWTQVDLNPAAVVNGAFDHVKTQTGMGPYGDYPIPYHEFDDSGTNPVDSPGLLLPDPLVYSRVTDSDSFEMYMQFHPEGGIAVSLRAVNWSWSGSATNSPSGWKLESGTNSQNSSDFDTIVFPSWNSDVRKFKWIPPGGGLYDGN